MKNRALKYFVFCLAALCAGVIAAAGGHPWIALIAPVVIGVSCWTASAGPKGTQHIGAVALIVLLLTVPFAAGCSGQSVAQDIVNWTPALQAAVGTIDAVLPILLPEVGGAAPALTAGFDTLSNEVVDQAKAYLASPNASALAALQTAITTLQESVSAATLQAVKVVNPATQKQVLADLAAVTTVVTAIVALVSSISKPSAAAIKSLQASFQPQLQTTLAMLDRDQAARTVAAHYQISFADARHQVDRELVAELMPIPLCAPGLPCTPPPCGC